MSEKAKKEIVISEGRDFKGIWIPERLYLSPDLSPREKFLLIEIYSLTQKDKGCFASNKHFANFIGLKENSIQKMLLKFEQLGLIERIFEYKENTKEIDKRIIILTQKFFDSFVNEKSISSNMEKNPCGGMEKNQQGGVEKSPQISNTIDIKYNSSLSDTDKEHALLSTKVDNRDKYMVSRTKSAQNSGGKPQKKEPTVDPDDFIKSKESVLKDELHKLYSNNPRNIFTTEQQENDWVDKEYNSLTAIIFEFNHQYKASTGFDAKNLSDESLKRVARNYIKSQESLKDDYDDLQSNKVLIEEYLKTDYGSKHGVIVKSLSHYMSGSIREMLFYKHLY